MSGPPATPSKSIIPDAPRSYADMLACCGDLIKCVNQLWPVPSSSIRYEQRPEGTLSEVKNIPQPGSSFPWNLCDFGYSVAGAVVTINSGEVILGSGAPFTVGAGTVTLTSEYSFVGWQYQYSNKTLTIQNFGTTMSYDPAYIRKWLYYFHLVGISASVLRYGFMNGFAPANFDQNA